MTRHMIAAVAALAALTAAAQDLHKEVTVDRVVEANQQHVERPSLIPSLLPSQQESVNLMAAEYVMPGNITKSLKFLSAAAWADSISRTPYRGYLNAGYFPVFNAGANAGYRFVDTDKVNAGIWAQYHGYSHSYEGRKYRNNFLSVGADARWSVNSFSTLKGCLQYTYASVLHQKLLDDANYTRGANAVKGQVEWISRPSDFFYRIAAGGSLFKFGSADAKFTLQDGSDMVPIKETSIDFSGAVGYMFNGSPLAIDFDGAVLHSDAPDSGTLGQFHLKPNYILHWQGFNVKLGANAGFATGYSDTGFTLSPDVKFSWAPSRSIISAYLALGGGEELNRVSDIFAENPYCSPFMSYGRYNIPLSIDAGVTLGRIAGVQLDVFGSWANARHWLMPYLVGITADIVPAWFSPYGGTVYTAQNLKSWRTGVRISYQYRNLLKAEASGAVAGSNHELATWYQWRDCAKYEIKAAVEVMPISWVSIRADYNLRALRKSYAKADTYLNLGNVSDLAIGADLRLTQAISVFLRGENLLNRRTLLISGLPSQGVHGLVGASVKF